MPWQAFGLTSLAQLSLGRLCCVLLSSLGLLYEEKSDSRGSTPLSSGLASFAGPGVQVGATWAQKSHPNGPKWPRRGKSEWPGQSSLADQFSLAIRVMETAPPQPRLKSSQRSKSIEATRHMIRSSIYIYTYIYIYIYTY